MWPKRKIRLVASSAAPGIDGVRALLKGMKLEFLESEDLSGVIKEDWWEKPFDQKTATNEEAEPGLVTDIIFWSEGMESNSWEERALSEGLNQQSIESFIHNILEDEVVLRVPEPTIVIEGRPLLGHILHAAGYEPTILWPKTDRVWQCEKKQGIHWVIPESWQVSSSEAHTTNSEGRASSFVPRTASWVVRADRLDFYLTQNGLKFVGQIPRWPEPMEENVAAETIARCLELGVSWLDIRLALSSFWQNIVMTDNLRWNINDIGWNGWTGGEELPSAPIDHVENWWAR